MSKHLKRLAVPRRWPLARKTHPWAPKGRGPHALEDSIPLTVALRDTLGVVDTGPEAKRVLGDRKVLVDGRVVTDAKRAIGLMDVLTLVPEDRHFRVLQDRRGILRLVEIDADRVAWKLCRVQDKRTVRDGKVQLQLHDGRNLVVKETDHRTGDVLRLGLPDQEVKGAFRMEPGNVALIMGGTHAGEVATIREIRVVRASQRNVVVLASGEAEISTVEPYVFTVGTDRPEIVLPEVSVVE